MDVKEIIKTDLIFKQMDFNTPEEVISFLAEKLTANELVKSEFRPAVLEREKTFPTALFTGSINVAIPHTDVKYVNKPAVAIATLKHPVQWRRMDKPEDVIPVSMVFMLAIVDPNEYVLFLSKLTTLFGKPDVLADLYNANSNADMANILLANLCGEEKQENKNKED